MSNAGQQQKRNRQIVTAGKLCLDGGVQNAPIIGRKRGPHNDAKHRYAAQWGRMDPTYKEAPIGFEPMVADLQSAGLATCLRRLYHFRCDKLGTPYR